jgi:quercetin dioxygenase-like cupin family protein
MRTFAGILAAAFIVAASIAFASDAPTTVPAGSEHWMAATGPGSRGVMQAVLLGSPTQSGFYVVRIREPANYRIMPHTHPHRQSITVLSGTYYLGLGRTFDKNTMTAYPAGSFVSIPPGVAHYAMAGSAGAVLQEDGMAPNANLMIKR